MRRLRILLVGVQALLVEAVRRLAAGADYEVIGESSGSDALDFVEKHHTDVVVLNIGQDFAGIEIETAGRIKRSLPSVAVVLITEEDNEESLLAALKSGANACLGKDTSPAELLAMAQQAAQGEYPITQSILQRQTAARIIADFAGVSRSSDGVSSLPARLLPLEAEILWHISNGKSLEQMTVDINIGEDTIKQRLYTIFGKLVANSRHRVLTDAGQSV